MRIVDAQMNDIGVQMQSLDEFVTRARAQNGRHHDSQLQTLDNLSANIHESFREISNHLSDLADDANHCRSIIEGENENIEKSVRHFAGEVQEPLAELQLNMQSANLTEYDVTGETPKKVQYTYPVSLPRTEPHEILIARLKDSNDFAELPVPLDEALAPCRLNSPTKPLVYNDADEVGSLHPPPSEAVVKPMSSSNTGLREVDINVVAGQPAPSGSSDIPSFGSNTTKDWSTGNETGDMDDNEIGGPPPKRQLLSSGVATNATGESKLPQKMGRRRIAIAIGQGVIVEGRENRPLIMQSQNGMPQARRLRSNPQ